MKKQLLTIIISVTILSLNTPVSAENSHEIDGITITAENFYIQSYTASDSTYDRMVYVDFTIDNTNEHPIGYTTCWPGYTTDGEQLETFVDFFNLDTKLVEPNSSITDTACFLLEKEQDISDEIIVTYGFMDYNEEYWNDFGLVMFGQMGQDEWESKYSEVTELEYHLSLIDTDSNDNNNEFSYSHEGHTFTYLKNEIDDNEVLIYFMYTNESGTTSYPDTALNITAFQNGIELTGLMAGWEDVPIAEQNASKHIQDGATIEVAFRYQLSDDSDISIEITPISYTNYTEIGKYEFPLNK